MTVSRVCILISAIWLAIGVGPGLIMQAELFQPGLSGDAFESAQVFAVALNVHGPALRVALPLTGIAALGAALFADAGRGRAWNGVALAIVIIAGAVALVQTGLAVQPADPAGFEAFKSAVGAIVLPLTAIGSGLIVLAEPRLRLSIFPLFVLGLIMIGVSGLLNTMIANEVSSLALLDTYLHTSAVHAEGVGYCLWTLAAATAWAARDQKMPSLAISSLLAGLVFTSGAAMVYAQAMLGYQGLPAGYADYPDPFAPMQRVASGAATTFVASLIAAIARLTLIRRQSLRPVHETFD